MKFALQRPSPGRVAGPGARPISAARSGPGGAIGWLILIVLIAVVFGLGASTGSLQIFMLLTGALFVPVVLAVPSTWLVSIQLLLVTVIAGSLEYFGKLQQANWLPTLIFMALLLRVSTEMFGSTGRQNSAGLKIAPLSAAVFVYLGLIVASAGFNAVPAMQGLVGMRHYLFPLSLTAVVALAAIPDSFWVRAWRWLPWLVILQFPVCLYQSLFVARGREHKFNATGISWDAVVGTFGGNADAGGASGALALFLCFGIVSVVALRRAGLVSKRLAIATYLAGIGSMLLAEVKVVAVFLPLAFLILNRVGILRSGVKAIAWMVATAVFVAALLIAYNLIFWKGKTTRSGDLQETITYVLKAEKDLRFVNRLTGEVSRFGAILIWSDENIARGDVAHALLGYGPAASKISSLFGYGSAARKHSFQLTTSTLSTALWDIGLLGVLAYFAIIALAFVAVCRRATQLVGSRPAIAAVLNSAAIAVGLIAVGTAYNSDALNHPAAQAMLALAAGLALRRWLPTPQPVGSVHGQLRAPGRGP